MNEDLENLLVKALSSKLEGGKPVAETREMVELRNKYLADKGERQNVATFAGCLSFASPMLPLGLLGFFFLLGKLDNFDQDLFEPNKKKMGLREKMAAIAAAEALAIARRKLAESEKGNQLQEIPVAGTAIRAFLQNTPDRRPAWHSEQRLIPKQSRLAPEKGFFHTKDKVARAKQMKEQKLMLEVLMESERKKKNFSAVSEISGRLETLEKLVRQMFGGGGPARP